MYKNYSIAFIISLCSVIICITNFDIVFDDSYDGLINNISNGQFSTFSLMDQHYLGILIIRDFYKFAQDILPTINVFSSMYLLSSIISLFYTICTLQKLSLNRIHFIHLFFFSIITMIFFLENIISITHTRFATIFCGVALINILFRNLNSKSYLIHFSLFLFGMLTRPESGMGMVLVVGLAYLIYKFEPFKLLKRTFLPVLSILILITTFYVHRHFTDRFEIKIEPDIEYAFSTGRVLPIDSMRNAEDSLRYEMGLSGMFIDTSFVSASFLKNLLVNQFEIRYNQIYNSTQNIIFLYGYYNLFLTILILMLVLVTLQKDYKSLRKLVTFSFFMFLLLIYLDYNVRVEDRHFVSLQIISFLVCLIYAINSFSFRASLKGNLAIFLFLVISLSSFSTLHNALGNQVQVAKDVECLESVIEDVEEIYQNRVIVTTLDTYHLFDRKFSFINNNYKANTYIIYDLSNYAIVPRNLKYLSSLCQCEAEKPNQFLTWAAQEKVVFISTKERFDLMEDYLKIAHNSNAVFIEDEQAKQHVIPSCMQQSVYNDYKIKRIIFYNE